MINQYVIKTCSKTIRLPESLVRVIDQMSGDNFSVKIRKLIEIGMMFMDQPIPKVGDRVKYLGNPKRSNQYAECIGKVFKVYEVAYGITIFGELEEDSGTTFLLDDLEKFELVSGGDDNE